jgi:hypothetical protein
LSSTDFGAIKLHPVLLYQHKVAVSTQWLQYQLLNLVVQRQWGDHQSVAIWSPLISWRVVHQGQQRIGEKEDLVYSIELDRRDEPSANKLGSVLCVAQDCEEICKRDYTGDSRGLVGCSWWESITIIFIVNIK